MLNKIVILSLFLLNGCVNTEYCSDISDSIIIKRINISLEESKKTSKNGLVLSKYEMKFLKDSKVDRNSLSYDESSVALVTYEYQANPVFQARIYKDCEIQWIFI